MILVAVALCLLAPATATAKFSAARICGPGHCHTVTFDDGRTLINMEEAVLGGMDTTVASPTSQPSGSRPRGPWYRVTLCPERCDAGGAQSLRVFTATGYVQLQGGEWIELGDPALSAYRTAARGVPPFEPASATSDPPSSGDRVPVWAWVAAAVAATAVGLLSIYVLRRRRMAAG
jgi:hypothetical protein